MLRLIRSVFDFTKKIEFKLFLFLLLWTVFSSLAFQCYVLPRYFSDLSVGSGLMMGDWVYFHQIAVEKAQVIKSLGWSSWEMWPMDQAPIGLASAVYALFGISSPLLLVPLHGLIYSLSGVFFYKTFRIFFSKTSSFIGILPFFLFPSAIEIYGQIHKDIWVVFGFSLLIYATAASFHGSIRDVKSLFLYLTIVVSGVLVIWVMKRYMSGVLLPGFAILVALIFLRLKEKNASLKLFNIIFCLSTIFCFFLAILVEHSDFNPKSKNSYHSEVVTFVPHSAVSNDGDWNWSSTFFLPEKIDKSLRSLAITRFNWKLNHSQAQSGIDLDTDFHTVMDVVVYFPRALQVGVLAPFPDMWFSETNSSGGKLKRAIAAGEMLISYIALLGFCAYMLRYRQFQTLIFLMLAVLPSAILVLVQVYVGGLYRYRYPFFLFWVGMGLSALSEFWLKSRLNRDILNNSNC